MVKKKKIIIFILFFIFFILILELENKTLQQSLKSAKIDKQHQTVRLIEKNLKKNKKLVTFQSDSSTSTSSSSSSLLNKNKKIADSSTISAAAAAAAAAYEMAKQFDGDEIKFKERFIAMTSYALSQNCFSESNTCSQPFNYNDDKTSTDEDEPFKTTDQ